MPRRRNADEPLRRLKLAADAGGPEDLRRYLMAKRRTLSPPFEIVVEVEVPNLVHVLVEEHDIEMRWGGPSETPEDDVDQEDLQEGLLAVFEGLIEVKLDRGLEAGELEVLEALVEEILEEPESWRVVEYFV